MRRREAVVPAPSGVRAELADRYRGLLARYGAEDWAPFSLTGWLLLVDELEAGEPVTLAGWQLARYGVVPAGSADRWFRVEPDGHVVEVKAPYR